MPKRVITEAFCIGKHQYANAKQANAVAERRKRGHTYSVYHCPNCGKWHLGNHSDRVKHYRVNPKITRQTNHYKDEDYE